MKNFFIKRLKKKFLYGYSNRAGRNFFGRKTILTQSGGLKSKLYLIDFKRTIKNLGVIITLEKDIIRTAYIGLICYSNGLFSYIILSANIEIKSMLYGFLNFFKVNTPTFLINIPAGNFVHHIESMPGKGAKLSRSAGLNSFIINKNFTNIFLKMNSGWLLKISSFCIGIPGRISNEKHLVTRIKNAEKNRQLGFRPKVRGIAMNPCDHPHGGGEGRGSPPKAHKTPWGKLTKSPTKIKKIYLLKKKKLKIFLKK